MFLAKLTIHGFKSFAKRTELTFGKGISAVVGPNGCGKTNIVDAIRWVIGEQKVKSLRSKSMQDVIFKGSREHKPMSMAEVQLKLKDCKGLLPYDPMEDTVVIGRRYYRSGDSEYLLNGQQVRLKDVQSILMGTGIGSSVYALIEQSMIQRILSGRKDDRRALFEEAAGIMKYKVDRKASESKLDRTEEDLARLEDILAEVQKNVKFFKRQMRRAQDLERMKARAKRLAVSIASSRYARASAALAAVAKELSAKEEQLAMAQAKRSALETKRQTLSLKRNEKEGLVTKAGVDLRKVESDIAAGEKQLAVLDERIANAAGEIESARIAREAQAERATELEKGIETAAALLAEKRAEIDRLKGFSDELVREQNEAEKRYADIRRDVSAARSVLAEAETDLARAAANAESAVAQIDALDSRMAELRKGIEKDVARLAESRDAMEEAEARLETLRKRYIEAKDDLESRDAALGAALAEKSDLFDSIGRLTGELGGLRGKLGAMEEAMQRGDLSARIRERLSAEAGTLGRVAELVRPRELTAAAMDMILGDLARAWVFADARAAEIAEGIVRESGNSAVLIVLEELPKPAGRCVEAQAGAEGLISLMEGFSADRDGVRFVSAEGDFLREPGIRRIGKPAAAPVTRAEELKAARSRLAALEAEERILRDRLDSVESREKEIRRELDSAKSKLADSERAFREAERLFHENEFETRGLEGAIEAAKERLAESEARRNELAASVSLFEKGRSAKAASVEANREELNGLLEKQERAEADAREKAKKATAQQMEYVRQNGERQRLEREIERMRLQKDEAAKSSERARERIAELQADLEKYRSSQTEIGDRLQRLFDEKDEAERAFDAITEEARAANDALSKIDIELREASSALSALEKVVHEKSMEKHDHEMQAGWIAKSIMEEYSVAIDEVEPESEMSEIEEERAQGKLDRQKQRIAEFGGVDPEAESKYEEEKKRFEFLSEQRADLLEASRELKKTIRKLDSLARTEFNRTFEKTRLNFRQIFTELFEGGEADLKLEEGVDVLEADVQISARPRGKRFLSIDQLSAGEKALCALSLLFGLYEVKPSPFCMLDEVDAPLDDANVNRFLKLIRRFSEETQFILITHNKHTMEVADYIYGVTMQEHGVSKAVSIKLADLTLDFEKGKKGSAA